MTWCHSVRDCHSPVSLFFQLSLVATLRRVKLELLDCLTSAFLPKKPMSSAEFFCIKVVSPSAPSPAHLSEAARSPRKRNKFFGGSGPSFFRFLTIWTRYRNPK